MRNLGSLLNNVLNHFTARLSSVEKILYSVLGVLFLIWVIVYVFETYPTLSIISISSLMILTGVYLFFRNQRNQLSDSVKSYQNFRNFIDTGGGNYNESIGGHYVEGDYINIQGNLIDVSKDIEQIYSALQSILTSLENKGYSSEEAQVKVANELANEARKKPDLKSKLFINEDTDEYYQAEKLINDLMLANQSYVNYNQPNTYAYADDDCEDSFSYKGYTINLESDKDGWWYYKIDDYSIINNTGSSFSKDLAIDEAKGRIDEERFRNW